MHDDGTTSVVFEIYSTESVSVTVGGIDANNVIFVVPLGIADSFIVSVFSPKENSVIPVP